MSWVLMLWILVEADRCKPENTAETRVLDDGSKLFLDSNGKIIAGESAPESGSVTWRLDKVEHLKSRAECVELAMGIMGAAGEKPAGFFCVREEDRKVLPLPDKDLRAP